MKSTRDEMLGIAKVKCLQYKQNFVVYNHRGEYRIKLQSLRPHKYELLVKPGKDEVIIENSEGKVIEKMVAVNEKRKAKEEKANQPNKKEPTVNKASE